VSSSSGLRLGARAAHAPSAASGKGVRSSEIDTVRTSRASVLIPTYGDAHLLTKSLPVFLADPEADVEIVVINNDPAQDVPGAIGPQVHDPRVKVVEMGVHGDFPRGVNRGVRESTGDLVMLCNADLFPSRDYLSVVEEFFAEHPRAGAAIGKLLRFDLDTDRPTRVIDSAGLILTRQRRLKARGEGEIDVGQYDDETEMFALDGAGIVVRRSALKEIAVEGEYLDPNFVAHKEDHDISWRLRLAGWECWYVPKAVAYHGRTTRGLGSTSYLKAIADFHRQEQTKSDRVRMHAMKNQWLLLLKNEDSFNFLRDLPFILSRELMVVTHNAIFAPRALKAIPVTLRILPDTLRKRRIAKARQRMAPSQLRRWLDATGPERRDDANGARR